MSSEFQVFADYLSLSRVAAASFVEIAHHSIKARGTFHVALSGGTTPLGMFSILSDIETRKLMDWSKVNVYWCDERCVPPDHPESNYHAARHYLLDKTGISAQNIHRIQGELGGETAARLYIAELKKSAAPGQDSIRFDLVILGLGADGHTASLFPGTPNQYSTTAQPARAFYQDRPADRVTLTPLALNNAGVVIFLVSGVDKSHAVKAVLQGEYDPIQKPAQRIHLPTGRIIWMLDRSAASQLS